MPAIDSPVAILLVLGGLLLLIGLGGGGISVNALKVERVEPPVRWLSGLLGAGLLVLGLMQVPTLCLWPQKCSRADVTPHPPLTEAVQILVQSELFPDEIGERASVSFDGLPWGEIVLDRQHAQGFLRIGLPRGGLVRYALDFQNAIDFEGTVRRFHGVAEGTLDIRDGQVYRVRCNRRDDDSYMVWLERVTSST